MIDCCGMALVLARGQPLWPEAAASNHLFINWLLELTLISRFNQAIMGLTGPLWILLGHYG